MVKSVNPPDGRGGVSRAYLRDARSLAALLGVRIRIARLRRDWTESELADRASIARATLQKIERGEPAVALGLVLECCAVLGLSLDLEPAGMADERLERARLELAALPRRVGRPPSVPDDDF